jgi:chemotaxis protein CheY-P-specific phosphatase CheC
MNYSFEVTDYGCHKGKKITINETDLAIEHTDHKLYIMQDSYEIVILKKDIKEFSKALVLLVFPSMLAKMIVYLMMGDE